MGMLEAEPEEEEAEPEETKSEKAEANYKVCIRVSHVFTIFQNKIGDVPLNQQFLAYCLIFLPLFRTFE